MNANIAEEWVAALRSGDYQQGQEALKLVSADGSISYCCLGVLCDIFHKKYGEGKWQEVPVDDCCTLIGGDPETFVTSGCEYASSAWGSLPPLVQKWAGIADNCGLLPDGKYLSELNDQGGKSFNEIADIIEQNVEGL
jgi:hypothetical protein